MKLSDLFERPLQRHGLRGDVYLWRALHDRFRDTDLPESHWDLQRLLDDAFEQLVGVSIDHPPSTDDGVHVAAFAQGSGLSDGMVSPSFWRATAFPIVIDRWAAARRTGGDG